LVEVALEHGAASAYRVDDAGEIQEAWLDGVSTVGLTSGASVPEVLVGQVLAWLAERGFDDVQEQVTAEEDLLFSLPQEWPPAPPRRRAAHARPPARPRPRRRPRPPPPGSQARRSQRGRRLRCGVALGRGRLLGPGRKHEFRGGQRPRRRLDR